MALREAAEFANPYHDSATGRFTEGPGGSTEPVDAMQREVAKQGGFTVHPHSGRIPDTGFQVAVAGRTMTPTPTIDAFLNGDEEALVGQIDQWLQDNADIFSEDGIMHIGGWHDPDTGLVHLDPSEWVESREKAVALGRERNQISIWDNEKSEEIPTGGTGHAG